MPDMTNTYAAFKIQGRLEDRPEVQTSKSGNAYLRFKLKAGQGPKKYPRSYFLVAFGDTADAIGNGAERDDIIAVSGEMQINKNETRGMWETTYVARKFEVIEKSVNNDETLGAAAMKDVDLDPIPF